MFSVLLRIRCWTTTKSTAGWAVGGGAVGSGGGAVGAAGSGGAEGAVARGVAVATGVAVADGVKVGRKVGVGVGVKVAGSGVGVRVKVGTGVARLSSSGSWGADNHESNRSKFTKKTARAITLQTVSTNPARSVNGSQRECILMFPSSRAHDTPQAVIRQIWIRFLKIP
jgi:hypothetical protein